MASSASASAGSPAGVAVLVVEWNSGDLLRRCLSALAAQTLPPTSVVVVDNASSSPGWHRVARDHPGLDMVRLPGNRGFAAGGNLGVALADGCEWIATLNPDAFPERDWLERLVEAAGGNPGDSFFASRQLKDSDPTLLDGTGDAYAVSGLAWRRDHGHTAPGTPDGERRGVRTLCGVGPVSPGRAPRGRRLRRGLLLLLRGRGSRLPPPPGRASLPATSPTPSSATWARPRRGRAATSPSTMGTGTSCGPGSRTCRHPSWRPTGLTISP